MVYDDLVSYLNGGIGAPLYDYFYATDPNLLPVFSPGPANDTDLQQITPQTIVFLTLGGGVGLTLEGLYDRPFVAVHIVGPQEDYNTAETVANLIDVALNRVTTNTPVGNSRTLYFTRSGGKPTLLMRDSAFRYHFTCSYIALTPSGL